MKVRRMHFVCRDDAHVEQLAGSRFKTGFWKVSAKHCVPGTEIALHNSKGEISYRQGTIVDWKEEQYLDKPRFVFTVEATSEPYEWHGDGTGEKGYVWE